LKESIPRVGELLQEVSESQRAEPDGLERASVGVGELLQEVS